MYTKTATAVLVALLAGANAADIKPSETLTAKNFAKEAKAKTHGCAGTAMWAAIGGDEKIRTKEASVTAGVTDALTCSSAAINAIATDKAFKDKTKEGYCVAYTPDPDKTKDKDGPKTAVCQVHAGYALSHGHSTDGTTAVYLKGGKFQDDAAVDSWGTGFDKVGDPYFADPALVQPIARYCRCDGGKWVYKLADGKPIAKKDKGGATIAG